MKIPALFPIRLHARDMGSWADNPKLAELIWHRIRGQTIWFATDCQLLDANTVELFVYEMRDMVFGGIGEKFFSGTFPLSKFGDEERKLAQEIITGAQTEIAQQEFIRRESAERQQRILEIRKELFGV
jgi:hypothetical protein